MIESHLSSTPGLATHSSALDAAFPTSGGGTVAVVVGGQVRFSSVITLSADQYTIIVHGRWFDAAGLQHDMARAAYRDVVTRPESPVLRYVAIALGAVLGALLLFGALAGLRTMHRRYVKMVEMQKVRFARHVRHVTQLRNEAAALGFPLCAMGFDHFCSHGRLISYEEAREAGQLRIFDTTEDLKATHGGVDIIFVSHQWKKSPGCYVPDPTNADFGAIVRAVEHLCSQGKTERGRVFIWVECAHRGGSNRRLPPACCSRLCLAGTHRLCCARTSLRARPNRRASWLPRAQLLLHPSAEHHLPTAVDRLLAHLHLLRVLLLRLRPDGDGQGV